MDNEIITIIEARPKTVSARLKSLWQFRGFYPFLFREISMKKFRDTFLGFWWLIIRPLVPAAVFIVLFTFIRPLGHGDLPYPIFFLAGFITWNLFHSILIFMPRTLLWMQGMMRRTYFPRLLVPMAGLGPPLVELLVLTSVFIIVLAGYTIVDGKFPLDLHWRMLLYVPCLLLTLMLSLAIGMFTSVVALFFRDIVFSMSYFAQMFMFLTPVIYPITFVPESYRGLLYALNPMAKIVEVSRWSLTGAGDFDLGFFCLAAATCIALFIASVAFFLRAESYLADQM
jgi:lipopolysaccharide transport system permease protein